MAGRQEEDSVALATLAEVQGTSALKVRGTSRGNRNTESASEGASDVSNGVYKGDAVEKLWASGPGEGRLPERNSDIGEPSKDHLAADSRLFGGL